MWKKEANLNGIICGQIDLLLDLLLQEVISLGLLDTGADGLVAAVVASRVGLEQLRTELVVHSDKDHRAPERSHLGVLSVHLVDVGDTLAQQLDWNVIVELVLEALGFVSGSLNLRSAVSFK